MATYVHSPATLGKLRSITQFEIQRDPPGDEWYRLRSSQLTSKQLFNMLEAIWPAIVGGDPSKYALIHCQQGQYAGVWFHLLPNAEYAPGCHDIVNF